MKFAEYIKDFLKERKFYRFDVFIIKEMGVEVPEDPKAEISDKQRQAAFLEFRKRTGRKEIATLPTIKRWFGIGSFHKPSREQVFEMCFAMHLSPEKSEEYLMKGLFQPSFQVNDYQEIIFLYGLERGTSFEICQEMIAGFEAGLEEDFSTTKLGRTEELRQQFEIEKEKNEDEFLAWMLSRAADFKGYSQTVFDYLQTYKKRVIMNTRREEKKSLEGFLAETHFESWCQKNGKSPKDLSKQTIADFLKQSGKDENPEISGHIKKVIWELTKDIASNKMPNTKLISENYSGASEKYLSDLFRAPLHRENVMRFRKAQRTLDHLPDEETCPDWILHLLLAVFHIEPEERTVSFVRGILDIHAKEYKRRCLSVQREDLLPLVFTGICQEYACEHPGEYRRAQLKALFEKHADTILNACNMPPLNDAYYLDAMLLACLSEKEMYSYSEVVRWERNF